MVVPVAVIHAFATFQFSLFTGSDAVDDIRWNTQLLYNVVIQHAHPTGGDRAHRQLLLAGQSQFPYHWTSNGT